MTFVAANYGEPMPAATTLPSRRRERLIEAHLPLVHALARRFARHGEPLDDLVQAGCIGLISAVDRYDPSRGHAFEAFAAATITGEIRHHLRDRSSVLRVPPSAPAAVRVEPLGDADGQPQDPIAGLDDRLSLLTAMRALPPRERRILLLCFYGERSQRRIADDIGLSQVHVSRLLRAALGRMRAELDDGRTVARRGGEA